MKEDNNCVVIPWDFTDVSAEALEYGIALAKEQQLQIEIIHIVPAKTSHEDFINKEIELRQIAEIKGYEHKVKIAAKVLSGNIFETIAEHAKMLNAWMVIMGTHGITGMQRYSGSYAYRVLYGSEVPFIIIKSKPQRLPLFKKIVLPIDALEDNIDLIEIAVKLGLKFNPKFYIIKDYINPQKNKSINTNAALFDKLLEKRKLDHEIFEAKKNTRFDNEIVSFAQRIEADLIVIRTIERDWADRLFGEHEQNIIDNEVNIPVMCVKPIRSTNL